MSFQTIGEYFLYDKIKKPKKKDKYLIIVYKFNENKKENMNKIKELKEAGLFKLNSEKEYKENAIRIFDKYFVQKINIKAKLYIIINYMN